MELYEVIKSLCDERGVAITKLEADLGFSRGSLGKLRQQGSMGTARLEKIAIYFNVPVSYLLTGKYPEQTSTSGKKYYFSDETANTAQYLYENKDLRLLFDAARDAEPSDLKVVHDMLLALKRKEKGDDKT